MALITRLQNIEKKYALTFLGFVLAIIFGGLTIYSTFFQKKAPAIKYEIESSAGVFDVREDVGKLDVIFDGVNLRETRQMLTLMTLKVSNVGSEPVRISDYDDRDPLGFSISPGEIIKAELLRANKPYLTKNLNVITSTPTNTATAVFSPVIIEVGDSFWVKILILHKEKTIPELKPIGTIAGAGDTILIGLAEKNVAPSFLKQVFDGTIQVQIIRSFAYFFTFIFGIVLMMIPFAVVQEFFDRRRRKKVIDDLRLSKSFKIPAEFEWLVDTYIEQGPRMIARISHLLNHPQRIYHYADSHPRGFYVGRTPRFLLWTEAASEILKRKLVSRVDGQIVVDQDFLAFVDEFAKLTGIELRDPLVLSSA